MHTYFSSERTAKEGVKGGEEQDLGLGSYVFRALCFSSSRGTRPEDRLLFLLIFYTLVTNKCEGHKYQIKGVMCLPLDNLDNVFVLENVVNSHLLWVVLHRVTPHPGAAAEMVIIVRGIVSQKASIGH